MPITIHLLGLEQLRSLRAGSTQVDGFRVLPGSLPTMDILDYAIALLKAGHNPIWYSPSLFIDEEGRHVIGSGNFHSAPENGHVEVGYEVAPACRGKGVGTEAVRLLVNLALAQADVFEVFAQTEVSNIASRRVLEKVGFRHVGQGHNVDHGACDQWLYRKEN